MDAYLQVSSRLNWRKKCSLTFEFDDVFPGPTDMVVVCQNQTSLLGSTIYEVCFGRKSLRILGLNLGIWVRCTE